MKISKIYISAFGGLKDMTLDLDDGMNVIFGENEHGKTTVMSFIRAMFYGTGKKTQSLKNSLRLKYTPLDGSPMGGRIYFEQGGRNYCLERIFNKSDSTDKATLTDLDSGEKTAVTNEIGNRIFGIGAEAFQKSMFISSERDHEPDEAANGDLNARLSAVALTGSEDTSFQKIEKRITTAKEKVLSKTERAGILASLRKEREELEERLEKAKSDAARKLQLLEEKEASEREIEELSKKARAIKRLLSKKDDAKNTEKLKEYLDLKKKLDTLAPDLMTPGGKVIDSAFVSKIRFCKAKLTPVSELIKRLERELEELENAQQMSESISAESAAQKQEKLKNEIAAAESEKEKIALSIEQNENELALAKENAEKAQNSKKAVNPALLVAGAVLAAAGIIAGLTAGNLFYICAASGAVLLALAFVIRPQNKQAVIRVKTEIAEIKEKIASLRTKESEISAKTVSLAGEMNTLSAILTADSTVREKRLADIADKKAQITAEKEKEKELFISYEKALDGISGDEENLRSVEEKAEEQKNIKLSLNYLSKDLGGISYEQAKEKLDTAFGEEDLSNVDFDKAEKEFERLSEKVMEENRIKTGCETELKTSFRDSLQPEIIERDIADIEEKIAVYEEFVSECEMCLDVLGESFASIRKGYGTKLNEKTLLYFKELTDGKYKTVTVGRSLNMEVERADSFGMFETGYLSTGTEDQAFLALRLAICDMIGEKENYPVFLDDALSNYDDKRTAIALEFLKEYSKNSQVILFTCHGKISEMAGENGTAVRTLNKACEDNKPQKD